MDDKRHRIILCEELEKAEGLPDNASEHVAKIRGDGELTSGIRAVLRAMQRAADEK